MKQRINVLLYLLVLNFYWIRQSDSQLCETVTEAIHNGLSLTPYWIKLMTVCSNGTDESCICHLIEKIKSLDEVTIVYIAVPESTTGPSVTQQLNFWTNDCEAAKNILGIVIGLLMTTLAIVMTGWGWTCWLLKRGAKRNTLRHSQGRVYSARNPAYMQSLSLESNTEQLPQLTATIHTGINNNSQHSNSLEEKAGESQENVYHILENPAGDDVYEVLDNYEKKEQDEEENVYHILDGPTVIEEEPKGVAISTSNGITSQDYEIPMLLTSTRREDH